LFRELFVPQLVREYISNNFFTLNPFQNQKENIVNIDIPVRNEGEIATVYASDYLNKISGEKIERECRRQIADGCSTLVVNFKDTEIVNSIGVSILLGVIDAASTAGTEIVFSDVSKDTGHLFEMLGLTNHVEMKDV